MPARFSPAEVERAFVRAHELKAEVADRQRAVGRQIERLAQGLAGLMDPGDHLHRIGVGIHAFDVEGVVCLAASYLEEASEGYRYRFTVLRGREAAKRALRTAELDHGDSDVPGAMRRVALAGHQEYDDFLYRLPKYVNDVVRRAESRLGALDVRAAKVRSGRKLLAAARRPVRRRLPLVPSND